MAAKRPYYVMLIRRAWDR